MPSFIHKTRAISGAVAAAVIMLFMAGCASRDLPAEAEGKIVVIATILPLADWAREVGGDRVYVQTLLPAGASPHTFDPSPRDMRLISRASLLLKIGLHMDDWGATLARSAGKNGPSLISLGEVLEKNGKLPDVGHFETTAEQISGGDDHSHHDHGHDHDHDHDHDHHHHHHGQSSIWFCFCFFHSKIKYLRMYDPCVPNEMMMIFKKLGNGNKYCCLG